MVKSIVYHSSHISFQAKKKHMSSNMKITPLKDVKPFKTEWQLHVKVLLTWKQCTSKSGKTLDII